MEMNLKLLLFQSRTASPLLQQVYFVSSMKIAFLSSHFQLLFGFTCINKFLQELGAHLRYTNVL